MKKFISIVLLVAFTLLLAWGIASPLGIRAAVANNQWSIEYLRYYFDDLANNGELPTPPKSFSHSSIFLARNAMKQGDTDQALAFIKDVSDSPHPLTRDNYASLLYQSGAYEQALEAWIAVGDDVTLERAANDLGSKGRTNLGIKALEGLYNMDSEKYTSSLALTLASVEKYGEALELFEKALHTFENSENRTSWLRYTADINNRQGNFSSAELAYMQAAVENPQDAKTWRNLGLLYMGPLNDPLQASACFQKYIEIDPQETYGYILLAQSFEALGEVDKAIAVYRQALTINPGNTTAIESLNRLEKP